MLKVKKIIQDTKISSYQIILSFKAINFFTAMEENF